MFDKNFNSSDRNATSSVDKTKIEHIPEIIQEVGTYDMAVALNSFDIRLYAYAKELHCITIEKRSPKHCRELVS
jgi:methylthioribose-1-phosphate isomerase